MVVNSVGCGTEAPGSDDDRGVLLEDACGFYSKIAEVSQSE